MLGRERIVGDLRCACDSRDRSVDLPALGSPMRPASAITFNSRTSQRSSPGSPGSASRGVRLVAVAKYLLPRPPRAALADDHFLARLGEVAQDVATITIDDDGARRHGDDDVLGGASGFWAPEPGLPLGARQCFLLTMSAMAIGAGDRANDDVAAVAAVAAVGAAFGNVLFTPKADAAAPAVAAFDEDGDSIDEHWGIVSDGSSFSSHM